MRTVEEREKGGGKVGREGGTGETRGCRLFPPRTQLLHFDQALLTVCYYYYYYYHFCKINCLSAPPIHLFSFFLFCFNQP